MIYGVICTSLSIRSNTKNSDLELPAEHAFKLEVTLITYGTNGHWMLNVWTFSLQTTFSYNASLWRNKNVYLEEFGISGLDDHETKMPSYWSTPFTKLCLGMRVAGTANWISINYSAPSLYSLLANNIYHPTNISRSKWKSLIQDSSLQLNCNLQGFNVECSNGRRMAAATKIGIVSNDQPACDTCDSRIGFGSAGARGGQNNDNSCRNEAGRDADNDKKHTKAFCYILLQ